MAWRDRIKRIRDVGGVRLEVVGPASFSWSDGVLPITLTFQGLGEQDQVVTQVEVKLTLDQGDDDATMFLYTLPVRLPVPSGQTVEQTYPVPLVLDDRPIDPSHLDQVPRWMSGLIRRVAMGTIGFTGPCKLEAMVMYEGNNRPGSDATEITAR